MPHWKICVARAVLTFSMAVWIYRYVSHGNWVPSWAFGLTTVVISRARGLMLAVECILSLWKVLRWCVVVCSGAAAELYSKMYSFGVTLVVLSFIPCVFRSGRRVYRVVLCPGYMMFLLFL